MASGSLCVCRLDGHCSSVAANQTRAACIGTVLLRLFQVVVPERGRFQVDMRGTPPAYPCITGLVASTEYSLVLASRLKSMRAWASVRGSEILVCEWAEKGGCIKLLLLLYIENNCTVYSTGNLQLASQHSWSTSTVQYSVQSARCANGFILTRLRLRTTRRCQ